MIACTLVILAAGIGSRFGGIKQLEPVGPKGEIIMEYTVRDAVAAGFGKIVFLIRKAIEKDFRAVIGAKIERWCEEAGVEVAYAYQEKEDLPEGFVCPENRGKPWGTGQALLACAQVVHGPFVVCNADDYYGKLVYRDLLSHLRQEKTWCLAGYRLANTLSCIGGVTRGICHVDEEGRLLGVTETRNVCLSDLGVRLDPDCCVSMNMWGFNTDIFCYLREKFAAFLTQHLHDANREFLLPEVVDALLKEGKASVRVLPTTEQWYGMTYREDLPMVRQAFANR